MGFEELHIGLRAKLAEMSIRRKEEEMKDEEGFKKRVLNYLTGILITAHLRHSFAAVSIPSAA